MGMSFALATSLLLLIGGYPLHALVALLFFLPSIGLMVFVERRVARTAVTGGPPRP